MNRPETPLLNRINTPSDLRGLSNVDLTTLAHELRNEVIEAVALTGGHLGSSLGVVELTVALHAVFDTPRDKLIWDVGHQCYPHKVLTGRRDRMKTLRQEGGISGFTKRAESVFDPFGAAHSSTSISAALGFTIARDMGQPTGDAIAVIGDGSISAGMAYEALNNAGTEGRRGEKGGAKRRQASLAQLSQRPRHRRLRSTLCESGAGPLPRVALALMSVQVLRCIRVHIQALHTCAYSCLYIFLFVRVYVADSGFWG